MRPSDSSDEHLLVGRKPKTGSRQHMWTYRRHRVNTGTMVLTHKRAPPARATNPQTGGLLAQAPVGTNPTTGDGVLESCDVSDVRTISPPTARWRSVHCAGR